MIEVAAGRLVSVRPRLFARRVSQLEVSLWGRLAHRLRTGDRCWLYYRQPRRLRQFLIVDYALSAQGTSLATIRGALGALDELARWKRCDAILCDVTTARISDRLLARWGWQAHAPSPWHRHFIKRFYGQYPATDTLAGAMLARELASPSDARLALCR
ncbi:MAG TPA: hypothetical protein VHD36_11310 [Pirellulales bacterium]|nr:hypothetical protein [Pirellulales bacterium]